MPVVNSQIHLIIILIGIILAVSGIGFTYVSKGPKKLQIHLIIEATGFLIILIGTILGMFYSNLHAYIGLLAIFLLAIGLFGGFIYKAIKPNTENKNLIQKKQKMRRYHILGGRITTIVLFLALLLGIFR